MKVLVMAHRADETIFFEQANTAHQFEIDYSPAQLSMDTVSMAQGYDAVAINAGAKLDAALCNALKDCGVKWVATRTAGKDHIDAKALSAAGLKAANVPAYSPSSIAEHTLLLMLGIIRKFNEQQARLRDHDFTITGLRVRELKTMTVGVIGAGMIGGTTIALLQSFGCKVLANSLFYDPKLDTMATFTTKEAVLAASDIVVLHCPLTPENNKMIQAKSIETMKTGAFLVNTARGGLVDTAAVLAALDSGKLAGFALDVYENEGMIARKEYGDEPLADPMLDVLLSRPDVIFTTHTAFYTDQAIGNIISTSLQNLADFAAGSCANDVCPKENG